MNTIIYKTNYSEDTDILSHFLRADIIFLNSLKNTVNLADYSLKLATKSIRFEAWSNSEDLVGIVCSYFEKDSAYITNVSVDPKYYRLGIGKTLLKRAIDFSKNKQIKTIELEVDSKNLSAINLYIKYGFKLKKKYFDKHTMELEIL